MLVSTKGRYALRVMIVLAENSESYAPLKEIAESEGISEKYMESILVMLTKVGILEGLRGKGGGYRLARPADEITVGSVLKVGEGGLSPVSCLTAPNHKCDKTEGCKTRPMWEKLDGVIDEFLESITLADLANGTV